MPLRRLFTSTLPTSPVALYTTAWWCIGAQNTHFSLDQTASPTDDLYMRKYVTIGNESRANVGYNVLRAVLIDEPFVEYPFVEASQ